MKKVFLIPVSLMLLNSCVVWRGVFHGSEDVYDYRIFPQDSISKSDTPYHFAEEKTEDRILDDLTIHSFGKKYTLEEYMQLGGAGGFIVIQNDTIKYENYFGGFDRSTTSTVFSVSKSLTSLLCGIALKEGYIKSIDDPVTDYIPELRKKAPGFQKLTVAHLLDMRTGLRFDEDYALNPFSGIARLYYGKNHLRQIKGLKFTSEPGTRHYYNSMATTILGIVIERATGKPLAAYMEEKVWQPLGMEYDAMLSLDDKRHRSGKTYGGFTTNVTDLAKIGRLYLNKGNWNGTQIVDTAWVERSSAGNPRNECYQNSWYSIVDYVRDTAGNKIFKDPRSVRERARGLGLEERDYSLMYWQNPKTKEKQWRGEIPTSRYYASGLFGQTLYVCPDKNIIMVRLGEKKNMEYEEFMDELAMKHWRPEW